MRHKKTRRTKLRFSWVQQMTNSGRVKIRIVPRELNLADHLTKGQEWHEIEKSTRGAGGKICIADQTDKRRATRDHEQRLGDVDALTRQILTRMKSFWVERAVSCATGLRPKEPPMRFPCL